MASQLRNPASNAYWYTRHVKTACLQLVLTVHLLQVQLIALYAILRTTGVKIIAGVIPQTPQLRMHGKLTSLG